MEETDKLLIELVKKNPCLYDPKDPSFKDLTKRNEVWQVIAKELNMPDKVDDAKSTWRSLRAKYKNRRDNNRPHNTSIDEELSFLEVCFEIKQTQNRSMEKPPSPPPTASSSSTGVLARATSSNNCSNEQPATALNSGPSSSTNNSNHEQPVTFLNAGPPSSSTSANMSHLDLLFEKWSPKARQFSTRIQLKTAMKINNILEEAANETAAIGEHDEEEYSLD